MKQIRKYNRGIRFLLCVVSRFSKICIGCSLKKEKKSKYGLIKKWLKGSDIEIYSTHNVRKPIVAERLSEL